MHISVYQLLYHYFLCDFFDLGTLKYNSNNYFIILSKYYGRIVFCVYLVDLRVLFVIFSNA